MKNNQHKPETAEHRPFRMHKKLLVDVIRKQAGTLSKAIMEGVMNAIDAKANEIGITINNYYLSISDDGNGFTDKAEIMRCFEIFGSPLEDYEEKTFGKFRMGRGQLFAFGQNSWRSSTFQMEVDIESDLQNNAGTEKAYSLGYKLTEGLPFASGCHIKVNFYTHLDTLSLQHTIREISDAVRYAIIPVTINGKHISTDPATEIWDLQTEDAYIKFCINNYGINVYNLGVFVLKMHEFGTGGIIVSKKQLSLNFARNDILYDCPIWNRIKRDIHNHLEDAILRKKKLTEYERRYVIEAFLEGRYCGGALEKLPLFADTTGHYWSAYKIFIQRYHSRWSLAPEKDPLADRAITMRIGIVFQESMLVDFQYKGNPALFFEYIANYNKCTPKRNYEAPGLHVYLEKEDFLPIDELTRGLNNIHHIIDEKDLTRREKIIVNLSKWCCSFLLQYNNSPETKKIKDHRTILMGISDTDDAWTDGTTYICLNRKYIAQLTNDFSGFTSIALLLLHEILHEEDSTNSRGHTPEFYQQYHDLSKHIPEAAQLFFKQYQKKWHKI